MPGALCEGEDLRLAGDGDRVRERRKEQEGGEEGVVLCVGRGGGRGRGEERGRGKVRQRHTV